MSRSDSFVGWMQRLKAGDDAAASEAFSRFASRLLGLARSRLAARLRTKVDPEDVVQSAYKSFFLRQRAGELEVAGWDSMWGLLTVITLRKCADRAAYYGASKRAVSREAEALPADALNREPQPEEALMLAETVEELFATLNGPEERAILELSLQGCSALEISQQLGRAERTVRRLRERVRQRLERLATES